MKRKKTDNGYCFKDRQAFNNKKGICYIPELSDQKYTYLDFLRIANNNKTLAQNLFDIVDWQHPETLLDEWSIEELI